MRGESHDYSCTAVFILNSGLHGVMRLMPFCDVATIACGLGWGMWYQEWCWVYGIRSGTGVVGGDSGVWYQEWCWVYGVRSGTGVVWGDNGVWYREWCWVYGVRSGTGVVSGDSGEWYREWCREWWQ